MSELIRKSINISTFGLLGKKDKSVRNKPRVMPSADDEEIKMAKRRSIARQQRRGGRVSTILSGGSSSGSGYGG